MTITRPPGMEPSDAANEERAPTISGQAMSIASVMVTAGDPPEQSEISQLVERCRNQDTDAWNALVARYTRLVYAIPIRSGLSKEDAADVTQATFEILFDGLDSVREPDRLSYWIFTVARRQVQRIQRREVARPKVVDMALFEGIGPGQAEDAAETFARAWALQDSVRQLHEPCRSLIMAMFFDPEEPSYETIAATIGRPVGSIGPLRGRCLARLRSILEEGGFEHDG